MDTAPILLLLALGPCTWGQLERERDSTFDRQQVDGDKDGLLTRCLDKWGCYSIGEPFFSGLRPISLFPMHPDVLDVQFLLVTRNNPDVPQRLRTGSNSSFVQSHFNSRNAIKMIVHGYTENAGQEWVRQMTRELLTDQDYNVVIVDWRVGAATSYPQAVANARIVGSIIADFMDYIQRRHGVYSTDIHIIGHDLGAHIAGYTGEQMPRLARITGLDPAGPYFENTDIRVRLDPTDAQFVDVIHTDSSGFSPVPGMTKSCGHVDFYPTTGWRRTGCNFYSGTTNTIDGYTHCHAVQGYDLFSESINMDCLFYGYACDSYANFSAGRCAEGCGDDGSLCARLGLKADEWRRFSSPDPIKMFMEVGDKEPFCRYHYLVSTLLSGNEEAHRQMNETGVLYIRLIGTKGRTALLQATQQWVIFSPGTSVDFIITSPNLGRLLRIEVMWLQVFPSASRNQVHHRVNIPQILVHSFRIQNLETGYREVFCADDEPLNPDHIRTLFSGGQCY